MSLISLDSPLSLYSIPIVWVIGFYPASRRTKLIRKTIGYNNVQPRGNLKRFHEHPKATPELVAKVERYQGAHENAAEINPFWIGAVLAGHFAGLESRYLNLASVAFIGMRVLYNYVYVNQSSQKQSYLRTIVWFAGFMIPIALFVQAGNRLIMTSAK